MTAACSVPGSAWLLTSLISCPGSESRPHLPFGLELFTSVAWAGTLAPGQLPQPCSCEGPTVRKAAFTHRLFPQQFNAQRQGALLLVPQRTGQGSDVSRSSETSEKYSPEGQTWRSSVDQLRHFWPGSLWFSFPLQVWVSFYSTQWVKWTLQVSSQL